MNVQITIIVKNNRLAIKKIARRLRILIHVLNMILDVRLWILDKRQSTKY